MSAALHAKTKPQLDAAKPHTSRSRIVWIDLLETIAIFAVVAYHSTAHIANHDYPQIPSSGFYLYYFFRSIFAICVPLFFFANGFLLFRKTFSLEKHFAKIIKFIRIAIIWYILTLAFLLLFHHNEINLNDPLAALATVKSGVNHLWYLGALVCLYIFFPLLKIAYDHHRKVFLYFTLVCLFFTFGNSLLNHGLTFLMQLLGQGTTYTETNFFSIFNPLRGIYGFSLAYFCLGGVAAIYLSRLSRIPVQRRNLLAIITLAISWVGLFGLGVLYSRSSGKIWDNVWFGYDSIFTLGAVLATFLLCQNWTSQNQSISLISRNTLGIYLIHTLLLAFFSFFFQPLIAQFTTEYSSLLFILQNILYTLTIFIISLLCSIILSKTPLLNRLLQ